MSNIINKIIVWFKNFFLSFYKSEEIVDDKGSDDDIVNIENTEESDNIYKISVRGYIKDYSIIDIKVKIGDEDFVSLEEPLGYKEEYILESDCSTDSISLVFACSIKCKDGEILTNLGFTKTIYKGETTIYVTDKLLGLKAITFGASVEDFEPVSTKTIHL